jgi:hypothetical protein
MANASVTAEAFMDEYERSLLSLGTWLKLGYVAAL